MANWAIFFKPCKWCHISCHKNLHGVNPQSMCSTYSMMTLSCCHTKFWLNIHTSVYKSVLCGQRLFRCTGHLKLDYLQKLLSCKRASSDFLLRFSLKLVLWFMRFIANSQTELTLGVNLKVLGKYFAQYVAFRLCVAKNSQLLPCPC